MNKPLILFGICFSIFLQTSAQQNRLKGEIIQDFGGFFVVEQPDIKTDTSAVFKIIFDVSKTSEDKNILNKQIATAARFLNMHANVGIAKKNLKVALTIHANAWQDVLNNKAYNEKFGVDNPNLKLIEALSEAGVDIILCGQTAVRRGLNKKNVIPSVKFALSAMTAQLQYQNNGYIYLKL